MKDYAKAILVKISEEKDDTESFEELSLLAKTAGYETVAEVFQRKERPDKSFYLGKGKLEELKQAAEALEAGTVIFDNDNITGSQFNNLEKYLDCAVLDRATVILEIFAKHATTAEGKLQVELARKKHSLPRVLGQGTVLSRQGGGGAGGGGARRGGGEQQLELDKRTIRNEIRQLEERIDRLTTERRLRRKKRQNSKIKSVSIVGYTNAGKSTLMNRLTKAGIPEEDKLFATLDTTTRKLWVGPGKEFFLTDTVGFISGLPHEFVKAFASTLEETRYSDLILLVHDCSGKDFAFQYDVVNSVLDSIGAADVPKIIVLNKIDVAEKIPLLPQDNVVLISAKTGNGIDLLKEKITEALFGEKVVWE